MQAAAVIVPLVEAEAVELRRCASETLMLIEVVNAEGLAGRWPAGDLPWRRGK
jgi:hypothetical protein